MINFLMSKAKKFDKIGEKCWRMFKTYNAWHYGFTKNGQRYGIVEVRSSSVAFFGGFVNWVCCSSSHKYEKQCIEIRIASIPPEVGDARLDLDDECVGKCKYPPGHSDRKSKLTGTIFKHVHPSKAPFPGRNSRNHKYWRINAERFCRR